MKTDRDHWLVLRRIAFTTLLISGTLLFPTLSAQSLDRCDILEGWHGANPITLDQTDKKEGTASLQSTGNGTDEFWKRMDPVSVSPENRILQFWYFVSDVSGFDANNQVELGSGNTPDVKEYNWSLSGLKNGWNLIQLEIGNARITGGTPDLNAIDWFRIYHFKNGSVTTRVDDIQMVSSIGATTLFKDDFHDGDYNGWTAEGTWSVTGGALHGEANSNIFIGDYTDFEFSSEVTLTADESEAGVVFRVTSPGTADDFSGYFASLRSGAEGAFVALQKIDHGRIELASEMTLDVEKESPQQMKIVCKGSNIWVFVNDTVTPAITEYDLGNSSGYIGLKATESGAVFDNVKVTTVHPITPQEPVVRDWSGVKGAVFVTSNSVNATQMMEEYDPGVVERELSYAKFYGFNTLQVNLHWLLWEKEKSALLSNFEDLLQRADQYGMQVIPVLFDDAGVVDPPHLAPYDPPVPGVHNSQMNTSPGNNIRDNDYDAHRVRLKNYVQDVVNAHIDDPRVLFWIPINEPEHLAPAQRIASEAYQWIKETGTNTLVSSTSGRFLGGKYSDFYTFHMYGDTLGAGGGSEHLNTGCLNRATAGSPVTGQDFSEMVDYFTANQTGFIISDLTIGRNNGRFHWESPQEADEPAVPFHGFIYPDGHPWSVTEAKKMNPDLDTIPLFEVEYFTGDFASSLKSSITPRIDFDLGDEPGTGSPDASAAVPKDGFSVRWLGKVLPKKTGTYTFYADCDQVARVWIDNTQVLNKSTDTRDEISGTIDLTADQMYDIKVEYVHTDGEASLHLLWEGPKLIKQVLLGNYYEIVSEEPVITSDTSAMGTLGAPFTYAITATKDPDYYAAGTLPDGLTINTVTGVISGLPTTVGAYHVDVSATNMAGTSTQVVEMVITADPFVPFINSIPSVGEVISTTNSVHGSTPITTKLLTYSSRNSLNTVYAIMAYPQDAGKYPGMLFLHGGGGNAETMSGYVKNFAALGYVAIACDLPGICGVDNTPHTTGPWKSRPTGESPRFDVGIGAGNSTLVDAEVAALEAFNLLRSQPNVDSSRMGVAGISWGGYSTTMVSGLLQERVKAAYAVFGCGYYEKGSFWKTIVEGLSATDRITWTTYLDAGRRAPHITAPYFLEAASNDTYFWPEAVMGTLEAIPEMKNHTWGPNLNHTMVPSSFSMMTYYFDYHLKSIGNPFGHVAITDAIRDHEGAGVIQIDLDMPAGVSVSSVKLYYSVPADDWQSRNWIPVTAALESGNRYTASLPASVVSQNADYYAYAEDARGIVTSSYMYNTVDLEVGINPTDDPVFKVYPNPSRGVFNVLINGDQTEGSRVTLFDMSGNTIVEEACQSNGRFIVNRPSLLSGLYILKIYADNDLYTKKIVVL
ncbi:MAG: PA14 domain-containing protein [Bacteroidota bacterium]